MPTGLTLQEIIARRGKKLELSLSEPSAWCLEQEPDGAGGVAESLTLFLTGAECPFHCTMCDLWKYTIDEPTPTGAIAEQVKRGLEHGEDCRWIKLYNASNFFDRRSVPDQDLPRIAQSIQNKERVIVENHPKLLRDSILSFRDSIDGRLEVAMGLETIHPSSFALLQKQFELDDFSKACEYYQRHGIDTRAFVMLQPPGTDPHESVEWAFKTAQFAFESGVRHVSVIPTRGGNGTMEYLASQGLYQPPTADQLEQVLEHGLDGIPHGRVITVDLWDWSDLKGLCTHCSKRREDRLKSMNLAQNNQPPIECGNCI